MLRRLRKWLHRDCNHMYSQSLKEITELKAMYDHQTFHLEQKIKELEEALAKEMSLSKTVTLEQPEGFTIEMRTKSGTRVFEGEEKKHDYPPLKADTELTKLKGKKKK